MINRDCRFIRRWLGGEEGGKGISNELPQGSTRVPCIPNTGCYRSSVIFWERRVRDVRGVNTFVGQGRVTSFQIDIDENVLINFIGSNLK